MVHTTSFTAQSGVADPTKAGGGLRRMGQDALLTAPNAAAPTDLGGGRANRSGLTGPYGWISSRWVWIVPPAMTFTMYIPAAISPLRSSTVLMKPSCTAMVRAATRLPVMS